MCAVSGTNAKIGAKNAYMCFPRDNEQFRRRKKATNNKRCSYDVHVFSLLPFAVLAGTCLALSVGGPASAGGKRQQHVVLWAGFEYVANTNIRMYVVLKFARKCCYKCCVRSSYAIPLSDICEKIVARQKGRITLCFFFFLLIFREK